MTKKLQHRPMDWLWRPADKPELPPSGDIVISEPRKVRSHGGDEAVLEHYFAVRAIYPRTAQTHPSTALAVGATVSVATVWWPVYEILRHYARDQIILSGDASQL